MHSQDDKEILDSNNLDSCDDLYTNSELENGQNDHTIVNNPVPETSSNSRSLFTQCVYINNSLNTLNETNVSDKKENLYKELESINNEQDHSFYKSNEFSYNDLKTAFSQDKYSKCSISQDKASFTSCLIDKNLLNWNTKEEEPLKDRLNESSSTKSLNLDFKNLKINDSQDSENLNPLNDDDTLKQNLNNINSGSTMFQNYSTSVSFSEICDDKRKNSFSYKSKQRTDGSINLKQKEMFASPNDSLIKNKIFSNNTWHSKTTNSNLEKSFNERETRNLDNPEKNNLDSFDCFDKLCTPINKLNISNSFIMNKPTPQQISPYKEETSDAYKSIRRLSSQIFYDAKDNCSNINFHLPPSHLSSFKQKAELKTNDEKQSDIKMEDPVLNPLLNPYESLSLDSTKGKVVNPNVLPMIKKPSPDKFCSSFNAKEINNLVKLDNSIYEIGRELCSRIDNLNISYSKISNQSFEDVYYKGEIRKDFSNIDKNAKIIDDKILKNLNFDYSQNKVNLSDLSKISPTKKHQNSEMEMDYKYNQQISKYRDEEIFNNFSDDTSHSLDKASKASFSEGNDCKIYNISNQIFSYNCDSSGGNKFAPTSQILQNADVDTFFKINKEHEDKKKSFSRLSLYVNFDPLYSQPQTPCGIDQRKNVAIAENLISNNNEILNNSYISKNSKLNCLIDFTPQKAPSIFSQKEYNQALEEHSHSLKEKLLQLDLNNHVISETWEKEKMAYLEQISIMKNVVKSEKDILNQVIDIAEKSYMHHEGLKLNENNILDKLNKENSQTFEDLRGVENAFIDLNKRYEKVKSLIQAASEKEHFLKKELASLKAQIVKKESEYQNLLKESQDRIQQANIDLETAASTCITERSGLKILLKKLEMKIANLESSLEQKNMENGELSKICDELIATKINRE